MFISQCKYLIKSKLISLFLHVDPKIVALIIVIARK